MYERKSLPIARPRAERPHGTRTRYVAGCRCTECRKANLDYWHENNERAKVLAREILPSLVPVPQIWTTPSGRKIERLYQRRCPGVFEEPCKTKSHLRKDSTGGICSHCRGRIVGKLRPTDRVLKHIRKLSKKGVGYKAVAAAASLSQTTVFKILSGKRKRIRADAERRILAVDESCRLDHSHMSAKETWRIIEWLRSRGGLTNYEINTRLGHPKYGSPPLRKDKITARNAFLVKKLYYQTKDDLKASKSMKEYCSRCGMEHTSAARREYLLKRLPMSVIELKKRMPCWWEEDKGDRALYRDLHSIGATKIGGEYVVLKTPKAGTVSL